MKVTHVADFTLTDDAGNASVSYAVHPVGQQLKRAGNYGGTNSEGQVPSVVAVRLDVDGEYDEVIMDEDAIDPIAALNASIAALTEARDGLGGMLHCPEPWEERS